MSDPHIIVRGSKLWLVSRTDGSGLFEIKHAVVRADDEKSAREIVSGFAWELAHRRMSSHGAEMIRKFWVEDEQVTCTELAQDGPAEAICVDWVQS